MAKLYWRVWTHILRDNKILPVGETRLIIKTRRDNLGIATADKNKTISSICKENDFSMPEA